MQPTGQVLPDEIIDNLRAAAQNAERNVQVMFAWLLGVWILSRTGSPDGLFDPFVLAAGLVMVAVVTNVVFARRVRARNAKFLDACQRIRHLQLIQIERMSKNDYRITCVSDGGQELVGTLEFSSQSAYLAMVPRVRAWCEQHRTVFRAADW